MRPALLRLSIVLLSTGPQAAPAASASELQRLEQAWHRCLREAMAHQPAGQSRAGNQRNALDECQGHENAFVAAAMADGSARDRSLSSQALSWAASVATSVLAPITDWIGRLKR